MSEDLKRITAPTSLAQRQLSTASVLSFSQSLSAHVLHATALLRVIQRLTHAMVLLSNSVSQPSMWEDVVPNHVILYLTTTIFPLSANESDSNGDSYGDDVTKITARGWRAVLTQHDAALWERFQRDFPYLPAPISSSSNVSNNVSGKGKRGAPKATKGGTATTTEVPLAVNYSAVGLVEGNCATAMERMSQWMTILSEVKARLRLYSKGAVAPVPAAGGRQWHAYSSSSAPHRISSSCPDYFTMIMRNRCGSPALLGYGVLRENSCV